MTSTRQNSRSGCFDPFFSIHSISTEKVTTKQSPYIYVKRTLVISSLQEHADYSGLLTLNGVNSLHCLLDYFTICNHLIKTQYYSIQIVGFDYIMNAFLQLVLINCLNLRVLQPWNAVFVWSLTYLAVIYCAWNGLSWILLTDLKRVVQKLQKFRSL